MSLYDLTGSLNTAFILFSLLGLWSQLRLLWQRRTMKDASAVLSLNQFGVSFYAYLAFFVYGYAISPFNHYMVWPRLLASLLVLAILFEIWRDRQNPASRTLLAVAGASLGLALLGLVLGEAVADQGRLVGTTLMLVVAAAIAQGYVHQCLLIWRQGRTGAVSLKMAQYILLMDISTIAFALAMGLDSGWPLLVLAGTSALTKLAIMALFRWTAVSELARCRRISIEETAQ
ncbi:hypothetical protein [Gallaecimonas sp. GXIMD4217]|uniref:hypothetical protein n=1 Tax=Gallaecimonas sp. GXIMD4217 TaxID=3131927 RepID=UPI00311B2C52